MSNAFYRVLCKLMCALILSSAGAGTARAHEVLPTIADLTADGTVVELAVQINLEAFLADINLDAVADTNEAENAADYDALRALDTEALAARAPEILAGWNSHPLLLAGEAPIVLEAVSLVIPQGVNPELPRVSDWVLRGALPAGVPSLTLSWPAGAGAMVLRQQEVDEPYTGYLEGGTQSPAIDLGGGGAQTSGEAFFSYIPVGFDHILPKGLDHILFVLGLFFLSTHLRPLIWQVSAFTLAHTVTLALGALGWVSVPASIVEPLIAASITYVAVENLFTSGLSRWRPLVIFGFGLLHGLGFASVLGEFGLPEGQFIPALIGFNIGVELGQLTVIAVMALCVWQALRVCRRGVEHTGGVKLLYAGLAALALLLCFLPLPGLVTLLEAPVYVFAIPLALVFLGCLATVQVDPEPAGYRKFVAVPASVAIAVIGAYWFVERVFL